jgi:hypothetical protein
MSSEAAMTTRHIIRDIIGGGLDARDKVRCAREDDTTPLVAETFCGRRLVIHTGSRVPRLGDGDPMLLCDDCLASLPLIEG